MENSSDTTADGTEIKPEKEGSPSVTYWQSQLDAYDAAADKWNKDVDAAFDEYLNATSRKNEGSTVRGNISHFPLFWSCARTIQPALYSRTPVIATEKAFKELRDPVARLGAMMYERLGKYGVKASNFDDAMCQAVMHFIMAEKVTTRVIFEADIESQEARTYYSATQVPYEGADGQMMLSTQYHDEQGMPYQGEEELQEDEDGRFYHSQLTEEINHLKCDVEVPHYRDYRHTANARTDAEIDWWSFDTLLSRTEFEEIFGEVDGVTFSAVGQGKNKDKTQEVKGLPTRYATVTQIWDRRKKRVYYLTPGCNEFLKHKNNPEGQDPYQLERFFPVPRLMLGTVGANDLFTAPAYVQLRDFIAQVHAAFDRFRRLLLAAKKCGIFDAGHPELAEINNVTTDGLFIGVGELETLLGQGGTLDKLIQFFPTDKFAEGAAELKQTCFDLENKLYDLWGVPDIYRGITDPNETLGAQQLKGKHMSVRFSMLQREVQRLARDTIEMMCDLYLSKCPDQKLAEIMGYQFMTPQEQQLFPQALALLKSDKERCIRLQIETDSTITQNMNANIEQQNYLAKSLFEGIASLKDIDPIFKPVAAKAFELVIKSLREGKQVEGELEEALDGMAQAAAQPQPQQPDPQMVKIQSQMQLAQQKAQLDAQTSQAKAQQEMQTKWAMAQADMQIQQYIAQSKMYLEQRKAAQGMQLEQLDAQHQQELAALEGKLRILQESIKGNIEMRKADAHIENQREVTAAKSESMSNPKQSASSGPHLHIGDQVNVIR